MVLALEHVSLGNHCNRSCAIAWQTHTQLPSSGTCKLLQICPAESSQDVFVDEVAHCIWIFLSGQVEFQSRSFRSAPIPLPTIVTGTNFAHLPSELSSQMPHLERIPSKADCLVSNVYRDSLPSVQSKGSQMSRLQIPDAARFSFVFHYLPNPAKT